MRVFFKTLFACIFLYTALSNNEYHLTDFEDKWFWELPHEGLYELNLSLNNNTEISILVTAVADLNDDKFADFIAVGEDPATFRAFIYDPFKHEFNDYKKIYNAGCSINSITVLRYGDVHPAAYISCDDGGQDSTLKVLTYDVENHEFIPVREKTLQMAPGS